MDIIDNSVQISTSVINTTFSNDFFRLLSLVIAGVFAGYTLQPVPKWLNNLFDTSHLFKFIVMIIIGVTAVYPLDKSKLFNIVISSVIILSIFEGLRFVDKKIEERKKKSA